VYLLTQLIVPFTLLIKSENAGVLVGVTVLVGVIVCVAVLVGVIVGVLVGVGVLVFVCVGVFVGVGVGDSPTDGVILGVIVGVGVFVGVDDAGGSSELQIITSNFSQIEPLNIFTPTAGELANCDGKDNVIAGGTLIGINATKTQLFP
jgi:hypothetical protein